MNSGLFAFLLFCNLFILNLSFADRGGVSGGGGGDEGSRAYLIDLNNDRSKIYLHCPNSQEIKECSECKSAISPNGNVDQSKLETLCDLKSK